VWDVGSGQPPAALVVDRGTLPEELSSSTSVLSPDGSSLALAVPERSEVVVWDIAGDHQQATMTGFTGRVTSLAFSRDGALLASAACIRESNDFSCEQSEIRLWDVSSGAPSGAPLVVDDRFVSSLAFSPDSSILASSGGPDNGIILWDVATGGARQSTLTGHERVARVLAFSPDGATLASGGGSTIFLWNVADGQGRKLPEQHTDEVLSLAFTADGATLASGGRDNVIRIWDVRAGTSLGPPLIGHQAGPSGALGYANAGVFSLAFVAAGETLISGGNDRTIRFWDVTRRQPIGPPLTGHGYPVTHLALTPDDRALVSVGLRGESAVYDIDLDSWRHLACDRANRNLTDAEWERYLSPAPYRATCAELPTGAATPVTAG
jgi:WD40 repeat protein